MSRRKTQYMDKPLVFRGVKVGWVHLEKPDAGFDGQNPKYKVDFFPEEDDPQLEDLLKFTNECLEADDKPTLNSLGNWKKDKATGQKYLVGSSKDRSKFVLVDAAKQPITDEPWRGSVCNVVVTPGYNAISGGCTLYLNAVQVLENAKDSGGGVGVDNALALLDAEEIEASLNEQDGGVNEQELLDALD